MTDYRSWERYDVDAEEQEADTRLAMEDHLTAFTPEVLKTTKDALAAAEATVVKTVDALKSKLAVTSKGGMRNRRRGQGQGQGQGQGVESSTSGEAAAADPRIGTATAVADRLRHGVAALHTAYAALPTGTALRSAGEAAGACTSLYHQALALSDLCKAAVDAVTAAAPAPPVLPVALGGDEACCSDPNCRSQSTADAGNADMVFCGLCDPTVTAAATAAAAAAAGGGGGNDRRPLEEFPRVFASPDPNGGAEGPAAGTEEPWVAAVKATAAAVQEPVDRVLLQVRPSPVYTALPRPAPSLTRTSQEDADEYCAAMHYDY